MVPTFVKDISTFNPFVPTNNDQPFLFKKNLLAKIPYMANAKQIW